MADILNTDIATLIKQIAGKRVHDEYSEADLKTLTISNGKFNGLLVSDIQVAGKMVAETVLYLIMVIDKTVAGTPKTTTYDGQILGLDSDGANWVSKLTVQAMGLLGSDSESPLLPALTLDRAQALKKGYRIGSKVLLSNTAAKDVWAFPVSFYWDSMSPSNKAGSAAFKFGDGGKMIINAVNIDPLDSYSVAPTISATSTMFLAGIKHEFIETTDPDSIKQINFAFVDGTVSAGTDQSVTFLNKIDSLKNPYVEYIAVNRQNVAVAEIPGITTTNILNGKIIAKMTGNSLPEQYLTKTKQSLYMSEVIEDNGTSTGTDPNIVMLDYSDDTEHGFPGFHPEKTYPDGSNMKYKNLVLIVDVRSGTVGTSLPGLVKYSYDVV